MNKNGVRVLYFDYQYDFARMELESYILIINVTLQNAKDQGKFVTCYRRNKKSETK